MSTREEQARYWLTDQGWAAARQIEQQTDHQENADD